MSNAARQFRHRLECCDRICLAVGKNSHCMDGWIAAKNDEIDVVEVTSWSNFFQKSSVDAILAENVWEHLSQSEGRIAARNSFQFLRPGGNLRLAVPDAFHPSQKRRFSVGVVVYNRLAHVTCTTTDRLPNCFFPLAFK